MGYEKSKKKIVFLTTIPDTLANFYLPLAEKLSEEYEVMLASSFGEATQIIENKNLRFEAFALRRKIFWPGNFISIFKMAKWMRKEKVDMVVMSTPVAALVGRLAAFFSKVPIRVVDVRGLFPKETHRRQYILNNITERILNKITTWYNFINKEDMKEYEEKGFLNGKGRALIPCGGAGINLSKFSPRNVDKMKVSRIKKEIGIKDSDFIVLFAGRLCEDKGIYDFIEIVKMLLDEGVVVKGIIAGGVLKGERKPVFPNAISKKAKELGVSENIVYIGLRNDMPEIFHISDILLLPSKREGFGMVFAEAAAMGIPVVAYDNRGSRTAVRDKLTGYIVPQGDKAAMVKAIKKLYSSREEMVEMGDMARAIAEEEYSSEKVINKYIKNYEVLLRR